MNRTIFLVVLAAAVIVFGAACGGGGGGGSSNNSSATSSATSGGSGYVDDHVSAALSGANVGVSLTDVIPGDTIQLSIAAKTSNGTYVSLPGSNWSTSAPSTVATVTSAGLLTVLAANSATYTVSGTGPNGVDTTSLLVTSPQAIVTGLVRNVNDAGVPDVLIQFYSKAGNLLTQAATSANGTFRASVPPTAAGFTINIETADPPIGGEYTYYREYDYGTASYLNGNTACLTALPSLSVGTTTALPNAIVLDAIDSGPPPPPSGCLQG